MATGMIIGHTFARRTTHTNADTHMYTYMNKVTNIELKEVEEEAEENATKS